MIAPGDFLCWMVLGFMTIVGCREAASTRHASVRHSAPLGRERPSERDPPLAVPECLEECRRRYASCRQSTPECDVVDRLSEVVRDPHLQEAGTEEQTAAVLPFLSSERMTVCVTRCGEPDRLCGRRCLDDTSDAGSLLRR